MGNSNMQSPQNNDDKRRKRRQTPDAATSDFDIDDSYVPPVDELLFTLTIIGDSVVV